MPHEDPFKHLEDWIEGRVRTLTAHRERCMRLYAETEMDVHLHEVISSGCQMTAYKQIQVYIETLKPKENKPNASV